MGVHLGAVGAANWSSQFSGEYGVTVAVTGKTKRASKIITPAPLPARTWNGENERLTVWGQQFAVRILRMNLRSEERTYAVGAKLSKRYSNLASTHLVATSFWKKAVRNLSFSLKSSKVTAERVRTGWANMMRTKVILKLSMKHNKEKRGAKKMQKMKCRWEAVTNIWLNISLAY